MCVLAIDSLSAMAAEAFYFFLDKKVTKTKINQVTSPMLLFAQGHCAAKPDSTTGCLDLPVGFARSCPSLHANLKGPLPLRSRLASAAPLSAEAGMMTKDLPDPPQGINGC